MLSLCSQAVYAMQSSLFCIEIIQKQMNAFEIKFPHKRLAGVA